jgi:hypothetical protein
MSALLSEEKILAFLRGIEAGEISLKPERPPQEVYAGDVSYIASNGWRITIFNDANEWDYIDQIVTSTGEEVDYDDLYEMSLLRDYAPGDELAWIRYGIPGYMKFRCVNCSSLLKSRKLLGKPFLCENCASKSTAQPC